MKYVTQTHGYSIRRIIGGRSNVFLLSNGKQNILVDSSSRANRGVLFRRLKSLGIDSISCLFLTHSHCDHADNASAIREAFGVQVLIHESEVQYLSGGNIAVPHGTNCFTRFLTDHFGKFLAGKFSCQPCPADCTFSERLPLERFGFEAYLLHTPGHTPGSSVLIADGEIAIAGDTVFGVFPWSAFPPYSEDKQRMVDSWAKLLDTGCRIFLPSHGNAISRQLLEKDYQKRH